MIRSSTARRLMHDWHSGQWSALYAAASSGLVESWDNLRSEINEIDAVDRSRLIEWLDAQNKCSLYTVIGRRLYAVLPWIDRKLWPSVSRAIKHATIDGPIWNDDRKEWVNPESVEL